MDIHDLHTSVSFDGPGPTSESFPVCVPYHCYIVYLLHEEEQRAISSSESTQHKSTPSHRYALDVTTWIDDQLKKIHSGCIFTPHALSNGTFHSFDQREAQRSFQPRREGRIEDGKDHYLKKNPYN